MAAFCAVFGDFAGLRLGLDHVQHVARLGRTVQAEHLDRNRRTGFLDPLALVVDQRADLAALLADDKDVALAQRAVLDQNRRDRAAAHVELRFDHGTLCGAVRVGLQFQNFGLQRDRLEQFVQTLAGVGRDFDVLHVAGHLLDDHFVLQQVGAHLVGVRLGLVDLVDRHDHRHLGRLGVVDRLDRLRHDGIIGRNHQHHDIRDLGTARHALR